MRLSRVLGFFLLCALSVVAMAGENKLGIREMYRVTFNDPIHVGTVALPAGEYVVRHTMQGEEHIMVFQRRNSKDEFKVKCTLVPLQQKAAQDQTIYKISAGNRRELQELIFRGDTAKHVF